MATTTTTKSPPAINALKSAIQLTDHHKNQSLRPGQNIHTGSQPASQPTSHSRQQCATTSAPAELRITPPPPAMPILKSVCEQLWRPLGSQTSKKFKSALNASSVMSMYRRTLGTDGRTTGQYVQVFFFFGYRKMYFSPVSCCLVMKVNVCIWFWSICLMAKMAKRSGKKGRQLRQSASRTNMAENYLQLFWCAVFKGVGGGDFSPVLYFFP